MRGSPVLSVYSLKGINLFSTCGCQNKPVVDTRFNLHMPFEQSAVNFPSSLYFLSYIASGTVQSP